MICRVYCRDEGGLVLVPDCMLAPREAADTSGPLSDCGKLDTDQLPASMSECIQREFDRKSYVVLSVELEEKLRAAALHSPGVAHALDTAPPLPGDVPVWLRRRAS